MRARIENGMDLNRRINILMTTGEFFGYIADVFTNAFALAPLDDSACME